MTAECCDLTDISVTGLDLLTSKSIVENHFINDGKTMTVVGKCTGTTVTARCLGPTTGTSDNPRRSAFILIRIA